MKPFILLLKIQLLGLFGINKTLHADPAKAKRTLALAALVVAAVVLFASAYSAGVAQGLVQIGLAEAVPLVAVLVGAIAGAVAAFLKTNGVLFGFKDYDLVMSLPVPTSSVVLSRIASLYAMSLLFGVLVMVPAFAVYASAAGVSAVGVACMALSIVLAPLLPLAAAVVLAVLIAAVSSRFKHANVAVIVLTLAATLAAATPIYFMNACIGYVLVLVAAVAVAVGSATGMLSLDLLPPAYAPFVGALLPWALAFFCAISSTTAASVSLEGSARWLMLTAPVSPATVLGAKVAVNLAIAVQCLAVSAVLMAVSLPLDALSVAALFAVPLAASMLAACLGLALDARSPKYDWTSVYEPVKRGVPVFAVIMIGMVFCVLGMGVTTLLGVGASLVLALLAAAVSVAAYRGAVKRGLRA